MACGAAGKTVQRETLAYPCGWQLGQVLPKRTERTWRFANRDSVAARDPPQPGDLHRANAFKMPPPPPFWT